MVVKAGIQCVVQDGTVQASEVVTFVERKFVIMEFLIMRHQCP